MGKLTVFTQDLWSLLLPGFCGLTYHIYKGSVELAVAKFLLVNLPYWLTYHIYTGSVDLAVAKLLLVNLPYLSGIILAQNDDEPL